MKLLLHINSLGVGGAETTVLKLAGHWVRQGHDVMVLTQTPVAADRLPVPDGVIRESTDTAGMSRRLVDVITRNLRRFLRLRAVIRRWRPDTVIGFLPTANVQVLLATIGLRTRSLVAERAWPGQLQLPPLQELVRDRVYPRADRVIVQTQQGADFYRQRLDLRNTVVIPNGIDLPLVERSPRVVPDDVLPGDQRVILFVGRLAEPKCPEAVVAAFAAAFRDRPEWRLVLIGSGRKKTEVVERIDAEGLGDRVHLVADAGNLAAWYRRAALFVAASRYEGFPNVLLEAMAHGLPCIAWNCPTGPSEIIQEGTNGLLVAVNDVSGLAESMRALADDPALCKRLGHAASDVLNRFSNRRFFASWDSLLEAPQPVEVRTSPGQPGRG